MVFTFARVGAAAIEMKVEGCFIQGRRGWVRLHEKGGKSLSATELVLEPQEGQPEVSVRGEEGPLPFPQVIATVEFFHLRHKVVECALETVYNTLRGRLGPEARQKLERDQLGWLITRETWRTNADPHLIKWTVENLTCFTADRVLDLRRQLERLSH